MADSNFPTLVSADRDSNALANPIFVRLTDGTDGSLIDASGNLQVILAANSGIDIGDVDVTSVIPGVGATNLGKTEDALHTTGDVGVMSLAVRNDGGAALAGTDLDYIPLTTDSTGALRTVGGAANASVIVDDAAFTPAVSSVTAVGFFADETAPDSVDEGDIGAARMTLDRRQLMVLTDASTESQRLAIDASGFAQVDIAAVSVTAVPVSATTSINSETNPIFVQSVTTGLSASEVHDFDTAAAVAGDGTSNHDYTVVNTTFLLKRVEFASSGGSKVEIQTGPVASLVTVAVAFIEKAGGKEVVVFDPPREVPVTSTGTVRVIRTNRQGASQDLYSTIMGNDV